MGIFKYAHGVFDRVVGARHRAGIAKQSVLIDPMQQYTTIGDYHVDAADGTPNGGDYVLTVYQDDKGVLHQALSPESTQRLAPEYVRKFNSDLGRFRAFKNKATGRRYLAEQYLNNFANNVKAHTRRGHNAINIGIISDTHFKDKNASDFYGWNGLTHVREFSYLDDLDLLDLKAHLGDWIDGSDAGLIGENELHKIARAFKSEQVPFLMLKGNHDENDKFDEHHDLSASFPENEFEHIMWPAMYDQPKVQYVSRQHGVCYFDFDDLRIISLNTSDVPYVVNSRRQKIYDAKLTLAVREDQVEELIEILEQSAGKQIILMSHGNPINRKGGNALKYNGRSLHELLVAFNQRERGRMYSGSGVPPEFRLSNDFDFTQIENAHVIAYFCGHRHREDQFRINGIQYILFNCSALMGPGYSLTTQYNKALNRKMDQPNEAAGYVVNVDLARGQIQVFGYGAASPKRVYFIKNP